ncbi:NAD/FAD-dependent oxidoreductase [Parazoarcus communis]|uniref:NAD/FAD-dependent oxidoreductase n=1 Tax=Parazoarcus communis TaxID=41977 RepID=A0A2U8H3J1_9RHOO|nr:FAD-dependent oxidoreductase [Parazoarcus communis]AWI80218.1 NAD/FAD-dependent oxidoreductase [Parazoarcus communis]
MKRSSQVAVVGAGLAGLSCASLLAQAGLRPVVFDKSRGPGGRMSTRRGEGWQCDHGAQYFTARDPDFRAEVERWLQAGVAALWAPRLQVLGDESRHDADSGLERFVGTPRMTAPARLLADRLELYSGTRIQKLERGAEGWRLLAVERGWVDEYFDAVVLAQPAPQAAALLRQSSLPGAAASGLLALADAAVMRGSWALMVRFSEPVALPLDGAFVNDGPLRWIARDSSKPGRDGVETWLLHANAQWSEAHFEAEAEDVAAAMLQAFHDLGGPAPLAWTAHRWRYADTESAGDTVCAWDEDACLGVCGDWLNGGKVEGAWLSGRALAQRILDGGCVAA